MNGKYPGLCIVAAVAFMLCSFRTGCRIIVNGKVIPGVHDPAAAYTCAAAARRTAEEITRNGEEAPFTLIPVLCLQRSETDETVLYHTLLDAYEGVQKLYAISADGKTVGMVDSLWEASALVREFPHRNVTIDVTYSYPEAADSLPHLRTVMHEWDTGITGPF